MVALPPPPRGLHDAIAWAHVIVGGRRRGWEGRRSGDCTTVEIPPVGRHRYLHLPSAHRKFPPLAPSDHSWRPPRATMYGGGPASGRNERPSPHGTRQLMAGGCEQPHARSISVRFKEMTSRMSTRTRVHLLRPSSSDWSQHTHCEPSWIHLQGRSIAMLVQLSLATVKLRRRPWRARTVVSSSSNYKFYPWRPMDRTTPSFRLERLVVAIAGGVVLLSWRRGS